MRKVIDMLKHNKNLIMPVKELWIALKNESICCDKTIEEFTEFLKQDRRLHIFEQDNN